VVAGEEEPIVRGSERLANEVLLTPHWPSLARFFSTAIITKSIDDGSEAKVLYSLVDIVRYLAVNDPTEMRSFLEWLEKQKNG